MTSIRSHHQRVYRQWPGLLGDKETAAFKAIMIFREQGAFKRMMPFKEQGVSKEMMPFEEQEAFKGVLPPEGQRLFVQGGANPPEYQIVEYRH